MTLYNKFANSVLAAINATIGKGLTFSGLPINTANTTANMQYCESLRNVIYTMEVATALGKVQSSTDYLTIDLSVDHDDATFHKWATIIVSELAKQLRLRIESDHVNVLLNSQRVGIGERTPLPANIPTPYYSLFNARWLLRPDLRSGNAMLRVSVFAHTEGWGKSDVLEYNVCGTLTDYTSEGEIHAEYSLPTFTTTTDGLIDFGVTLTTYWAQYIKTFGVLRHGATA